MFRTRGFIFWKTVVYTGITCITISSVVSRRVFDADILPLARLPIPMHVKHTKGKAVPLQARSGPEGSRKLRFPDFMTTAQEGDKVVSLTHRPPLPPGNTPGTHFC